jgi:hypothetical protein
MARQKLLPVRNELQDAFDVHSALLTAELTFPALRDIPRWQLLRMDAFELFYNLMEDRCDGK